MFYFLQGNEALFSLETASDYVKDEKACFYGFKCYAIGYEFSPGSDEVRKKWNGYKWTYKFILIWPSFFLVKIIDLYFWLNRTRKILLNDFHTIFKLLLLQTWFVWNSLIWIYWNGCGCFYLLRVLRTMTLLIHSITILSITSKGYEII